MGTRFIDGDTPILFGIPILPSPFNPSILWPDAKPAEMNTPSAW